MAQDIHRAFDNDLPYLQRIARKSHPSASYIEVGSLAGSKSEVRVQAWEAQVARSPGAADQTNAGNFAGNNFNCLVVVTATSTSTCHMLFAFETNMSEKTGTLCLTFLPGIWP